MQPPKYALLLFRTPSRVSAPSLISTFPAERRLFSQSFRCFPGTPYSSLIPRRSPVAPGAAFTALHIAGLPPTVFQSIIFGRLLTIPEASMEDNYQRSWHGLSSQDFVSRSLSSSAEPTGQGSLDTSSPMHYQASMSMAETMAMWQNMPTRQPNNASMTMMAQGQQHSPATLMMLQSQGLSYYPAPVKMFSPTMQQSQNAQFYHASLASSKRFSEEEKQKLEKVFVDETQKPSTSRKRQLAEELGCPVPKVNVG